MIIPLMLTGGAYEIYQQLGNDVDLDQIKCTLYKVFGTDTFVAWQQFVGEQLCPGKRLYLADLCKISVLFSSVNDQILGCAFLAGSPKDVSRLL